MKRYYTVKEAAKILGFSTNTIYKYLEEGSLKGRRLGGRGRFKIPFSQISPYLSNEATETTEKQQGVEEEVNKTFEEEQENENSTGRLAVFELFSGMVVGLGIVYVIWNFGVIFLDLAKAPIIADTAIAVWNYSGRTSSGFGSLVSEGTNRLAGSITKISAMAASKLTSQTPVPKLTQEDTNDPISEESPKEEVDDQVLVLDEEPKVKRVIITETPTGWLRVRSAPWGEEIGKVYPEDSFEVLDESDEWFLIKTSDAQEGWISSEYASIELDG